MCSIVGLIIFILGSENYLENNNLENNDLEKKDLKDKVFLFLEDKVTRFNNASKNQKILLTIAASLVVLFILVITSSSHHAKTVTCDYLDTIVKMKAEWKENGPDYRNSKRFDQDMINLLNDYTSGSDWVCGDTYCLLTSFETIDKYKVEEVSYNDAYECYDVVISTPYTIAGDTMKAYNKIQVVEYKEGWMVAALNHHDDYKQYGETIKYRWHNRKEVKQKKPIK